MFYNETGNNVIIYLIIYINITINCIYLFYFFYEKLYFKELVNNSKN